MVRPRGPGRRHDAGVDRLRRYLLLYRFLIVNIVGAALFGLAGAQGWLTRLVEADPTGLVFVIFGVFAVGLALCGYRLFKTSAALNRLEADGTVDLPMAWTRTPVRPELMAEALKALLFSRIAVVRQIASALVVLGLIGTVTGFIIALSGVSAEDAGTLAAVQPMISTLISGMSVALYTTLEGAVLGLWLTVNYRMLATGTATLYSELLAADGRV